MQMQEIHNVQQVPLDFIFHRLQLLLKIALHLAALHSDVEGVNLLLRSNADRTYRTKDGRSAADIARLAGNSAAEVLLS